MPGYNHYSDCTCGWCEKDNNEAYQWLPFSNGSSFVNPNAICPVCGAHVYYYENSNGSRVFFDDLGWPWPKHPCTDLSSAQSAKIRMISNSPTTVERHFLDRSGKRLDLYELRYWREKNDGIRMKFDRMNGNSSFEVRVKKSNLKKARLNKTDFIEAPSFAVRVMDSKWRHIDFISISKQKIISLKVPRLQ